jgi:hypothetical protein
MNIGEIAERFIRAAEIDRNTRERVGPSPLRAQQLPYVHTFADKLNWRREIGDKLLPGSDPLSEERKAFWDRVGLMPSASEISEAEVLHAWLTAVDNEMERRALLAWARSKVGGKSFRRWCFAVEGIHPETGRRRKNRALARIGAEIVRKNAQHSRNGQIRLLQPVPEMGDVSDTIAEDVGKRERLNSWASDDAFQPFLESAVHDFNWADKRNARRRQQEAKRRKVQPKVAA